MKARNRKPVEFLDKPVALGYTPTSIVAAIN